MDPLTVELINPTLTLVVLMPRGGLKGLLNAVAAIMSCCCSSPSVAIAHPPSASKQVNGGKHCFRGFDDSWDARMVKNEVAHPHKAIEKLLSKYHATPTHEFEKRARHGQRARLAQNQKINAKTKVETTHSLACGAAEASS